MRTIYLIRHGLPDIPNGRRMCLGRTDMPIGSVGKLQSALIGVALKDSGLTALYCSRLSRSRQTAEIIGSPVTQLDGLEEMDAGEWDGLFFKEITARWPELYELRGKDPSIQPPGSESPESGQKRFSAAVHRAIAESAGSIAIVAHASVIQTFLCKVTGMPLSDFRRISLPYGSITCLTYEDGAFSAAGIGVSPHPEPDENLCIRLLNALDTPQAIAAHCGAVAKTALDISEGLNAAGVSLNNALVYPAAMLHDIARREPKHAAAGADWLNTLGYPDLADIVRQHHELDCPERVDEAAVVFLADKLVQGEKRVSLHDRFAASREKCDSPEALSAHNRRYETAKAVAAKINSICGKDLVV